MSANSRNHSFNVKVGEGDFDALADLCVEEVVALRVAWIEAGEIRTPKRSVGRHRTVELERARHRRDLLTGRYATICNHTCNIKLNNESMLNYITSVPLVI